MLIGLVLGWTLDESFYDAGIGALLGLGIGQAIRLSRLAAQADQQALQLETTQKALIALGDRLRQLEVPAPTQQRDCRSPPIPDLHPPLPSPRTCLGAARRTGARRRVGRAEPAAAGRRLGAASANTRKNLPSPVAPT